MRQLRREAAARGLDPNVWFNNVARIASERIGRETVTYVSNIYRYYVTYLLIQGEYLERRELREEDRLSPVDAEVARLRLIAVSPTARHAVDVDAIDDDVIGLVRGDLDLRRSRQPPLGTRLEQLLCVASKLPLLGRARDSS